MKRLGSIITGFLLLISGSTLLAWEPETYHVAVLPARKSQAHAHEFDFALKGAGMTWTNVAESAAAMDWLADNLDKFNLLLGPPLFGYTSDAKTDPIPYDMKKYAARIRQWVERGGCMMIVDANYPEPLDWLKSLDPSLEISKGHCGDYGPAVVKEPLDSILFFPKSVEYGFTWGHLAVPEKSGWKTCAACGHGNPTMVIRRLGRGIIIVSSLRRSYPALVENIRVNAAFLSLGLEVLGSSVPDPFPGTNTFSITCRNQTDKPVPAELELRLTRLDRDAEGRSVLTGEPTTYRSKGMFNPQATSKIQLDCRIALRGRVRAELILKTASAAGVCMDREIELAPLFALQSSRYRGAVSVSRRFDEVKFGTRIFPDREDLKTHAVKLSVIDAKGLALSEKTAPAVAGQNWIPVPLGRQLPPGVYTVRGELFDGTKAVASDTTTVEILEPVPGQAVFDEDKVLLVDGKPYFTLGIYHATGNYFPEIADLGFNLIQVFSWMGRRVLDQTHQVGTKALWEQNNICEGVIQSTAANCQGHPSTLLYYTLDEPSEDSFNYVMDIDRWWRMSDPHHPTYVVSYMPHLFSRNAQLSDILAPDPYPYWKGKGEDSPIDMVAGWMDRANAASNGNRPYFCVPQSFGHEPPHIWRCMAFLAVTHGAKGLIWYPWSEGEKSGKGMRFNDGLKEAARTLLSEFRTLSPAFMNAKDQPRGFTDKDDTLHGMTCRDPETGTRYLLLANSSKVSVSAALDVPELDAGLAQVEGAFSDKPAMVSGGKLDVKLEPFGTRVYAWGGPKPVKLPSALRFAVRPMPARASGRTLEVTAGGDLQAAVNAAKDGDVIRVVPGTYAPFVSDNKLLDIVSSGAATNTFIDAGGKGRCATLSVKPFGDMAFQTNTLLRGFTLRGGNSEFARIHPEMGGAVYGGTLEKCVVEKSVSDYGGGAAHANLIGTILRANRALKNGGAATLCSLAECEVVWNKAVWDGGGLSFCKTENSLIAWNTAGRDGGGVHYGDTGASAVRHNRAGRHGGGTAAMGTVRDTLVENNTAAVDGGGIYNGHSSNCTIVKNKAGRFGGGTGDVGKNDGPDSSVSSCIIWGNAADGDANTRSFVSVLPTDLSFAEWTNAVPGRVCTNDPGFVNFGCGDYRLRADSPCIDRLRKKTAKDVCGALGFPRLRGASLDVGAFEAVEKTPELFVYEWPLATASDLKMAAAQLVSVNRKAPVEDGFGIVFDGTYGLHSRSVINLSTDTLTRVVLTCRFRCEPHGGGTLFHYGSVGGIGSFALSIDVATGRLSGSVVIGCRGKNAVRSMKTMGSGTVADGKWHVAEFTVDRSEQAEKVTRLVLDGLALPPATGESEGDLWFTLGRSPVHIGSVDDSSGFFIGGIEYVRLMLQW